MAEITQSSGGAPLFPLGRVVATPGALGEGDRQMNHAGLLSGERLLSAYDLPDQTRVWIITESDRSGTTLLLPGDY